MNLSNDLMKLEAEPLVDAVLAVRDRLVDPEQLGQMHESMAQRYPRLGVLPELVIDGLGHGSTPEQKDEMMKGALLAVVVLAQYADIQELEQKFPDMPVVPHPRSGS